MDNLTALSNSLSFHLDKPQVEVIAISRGLDLEAEFSSEYAKSSAFELSMADMIRTIVTTPNVSEGGVSISYNNLGALIGMANRIYAKYGESPIGESYPTVRYLEDF